MLSDQSARARSLLEESVALHRGLGNKFRLSVELVILGGLERTQGEYIKTRTYYEEALALLTEIRKERQSMEGDIAWTLFVVAQIEALQGNYPEAQNHYDEILTVAREINDKWNLPIYLNGLAEVAAMQGELIWAARLLGAAELLLDRADFLLPPVYQTGHERAVAAVSARLGEQAFAIAIAEGRSMTLEQVLAPLGRAEVFTPTLEGHPSTNAGKPSPHYSAGMERGY